ncbi:hypothetical protein DFJ73DRAFT_611664, partial [Zopfochytrium polystomum]
HFFTQMPQPIQSSSEMKAILDEGSTSMQSFPVIKCEFRLRLKCAALSSLPILTTGHPFLHSCRHFFGLHLSELTIAIRVSFS